jgi:hypothetical protein
MQRFAERVHQNSPSNLIGANGFAVEDQSQGRRGLCAVADATAGSALDCDLGRKKSSAPLDVNPALIGLARCRRPRDGEQPHTQGSGAIRPASVLRPERSRAAGRNRLTPGARNRPPSFPAEDQVAMLALHTHSSPPLRTFCYRSLRARPVHGVPEARALETVEKVVTTSPVFAVSPEGGSTDRSLSPQSWAAAPRGPRVKARRTG